MNQFPRNIRWFIAFRILFNSRFYYPVFAVLFLDFGLSMEQFALLNVAWAVTIVLLEVPSGALADLIGRRRLVLISAGLMVIEMAVLCFVPLGNVSLVFCAFLVNRIISGVSEAAASGADEALAYDSMPESEREELWPRVLEFLMRAQSIGFLVAMGIGAVLYDPQVMQRCAISLGIDVELNQQITMRFPLYLNFVTAALTFIAALQLKETATARDSTDSGVRSPSVRETWLQTLRAGMWILKTPPAFIIILSVIGFDSIIRLFITVSSNFFRLIELPEASFGLINAGLALMGFFVPSIARNLAQNRSPLFNFWLMAIILLVGLFGAARAWTHFGLAFVVLIFVCMSLLSFFASHYLNAVADSSKRATILSFKGLAMNFGYGAIGIMFAIVMRNTESRAASLGGGEEEAFAAALFWFPWYFVAVLVALVLAGNIILRGSEFHRRPS